MENPNINLEGNGTGVVGNYEHKGAYSHSFGPVANKSIYSDPWNKIDLRPELSDLAAEGMAKMGLKALTTETGGPGTTGFALVPIYVDQRIVDVTRKRTPLVELIRRVTNEGLTADWNQITAKGGGYTAAEDAATPETTDTYDRKSTPIKFLYSVGRTTGPMQAGMPSYILEGFNSTGSGLGGDTFSSVGAASARQQEVLIKARSIRELEESLIVNGDADTDATQFSGIVKLQGTTNVVDLLGAALTWDDLETAVQYAFDAGGQPNLAVGSSSVVKDIRALIIDTFRYSPSDLQGSLPFGVSAAILLDTMVGAIPLIPSMYLSNTSGAKQIYFLDLDFIEMRVLQDMTYEDLAHTNDSYKFLLKIYECLVFKNEAFNSFVDNIQ